MESFDMSHPIDQIDKVRTKPLQIENDGQMSSISTAGCLDGWSGAFGRPKDGFERHRIAIKRALNPPH
jgi:hypothetical protein